MRQNQIRNRTTPERMPSLIYKELKKMKIAVLIGHGKSENGGYDPGAKSEGVHEFRVAKEIGKFIDEILDGYECAHELINYKGDIYLYDRAAYVRRKKFDLCIELHLNAFNNKASGTETYYMFESNKGKSLAASISNNIAKYLGVKNRGAKVRTYKDKKTGKTRDYFCIVREAGCESLLIETVFVDSKSDREKIVIPENQKECAQAIVDAIAKMYKIKKKNVAPNPVKPVPVKPNDKTKFKKGDKVNIIGTYYATGQKIPDWVKGDKDKPTVYTIKNNPDEDLRGWVLLKEINSYVKPSDIVHVKPKPSKPKKIDVGDTVTIKSGAVYGGLASARGKKVGKSYLAPRKYKVTKIQTNLGVKEALLGGINSWVALDYLTEVN